MAIVRSLVTEIPLTTTLATPRSLSRMTSDPSCPPSSDVCSCEPTKKWWRSPCNQVPILVALLGVLAMLVLDIVWHVLAQDDLVRMIDACLPLPPVRLH